MLAFRVGRFVVVAEERWNPENERNMLVFGAGRLGEVNPYV